MLLQVEKPSGTLAMKAAAMTRPSIKLWIPSPTMLIRPMGW